MDVSYAQLRTGPPLSNPAWKETERASHEDCKVASKAMVGRKEMYLCRRVSRWRGFKASHIGGATYIECLAGAHFSLSPFGVVFVGFMDMFRITIEAVVELHVALR
jgi:hypothetical protein